MASQLGAFIRVQRTKQNLLLRHLASKMDVDTSIISKIERGERPIKRNQIIRLASILHADKEELLILWLADQVYDVVKDEDNADEALKKVSNEMRKPKKSR